MTIRRHDVTDERDLAIYERKRTVHTTIGHTDSLGVRVMYTCVLWTILWLVGGESSRVRQFNAFFGKAVKYYCIFDEKCSHVITVVNNISRIAFKNKTKFLRSLRAYEKINQSLFIGILFTLCNKFRYDTVRYSNINVTEMKTELRQRIVINDVLKILPS